MGRLFPQMLMLKPLELRLSALIRGAKISKAIESDTANMKGVVLFTMYAFFSLCFVSIRPTPKVRKTPRAVSQTDSR